MLLEKSEHILILGGGMAGLAAALALQAPGRRVRIIERDPAPPEFAPEEVFDGWKRSGVPQLRHTHVFMGRLQAIFRRDYPELLAEIERAGIRRGTIDEVLPPSLRGRWEPRASDADILHLWGRRATLEYVIRQHAERHGIEFIHDTSVEQLVFEPAGRSLRVRGALVRTQAHAQRLEADVVIDALGARSKVPVWLEEAGCKLQAESTPSQVGYHCRHFVQVSREPEPPRQDTAVDLGYLLGGVFFAEQGTFSIALTCPESETELLQMLRRPEGFDEICSQIPNLARWRERGEPISRVLGGANLQNRWYRYAKAGALGLFPVGDSYVQTNPVYGRGCSAAFIQAQQLRYAFAATGDPSARARRYHRGVWRQLRPYFDLSRNADSAVKLRARRARGEPLALGQRVFNRFFERVFVPALDDSRLIVRQWLVLHSMGEPGGLLGGLLVLLYMHWLWLLRSLRRGWKPSPPTGPTRLELLHACRALAPAALSGEATRAE